MTGSLSVVDAPLNRVEGSLAKPQAGELHLWYWDTTFDERARLNHHERDRYERLIPPDVRQHYLSAHTGLQTILGGYLCLKPGEVEWSTDPHGKPYLDKDAPLHFNLSHSSGANLLAVSGDNVGIDIERIRSVTSQEGLARKYYTQREQQELASLPAQESIDRFFAFWTRKEAFVKLLGTGLQGELSSIDVGQVIDEGCEVARADGRDLCWLSDIVVPGEFRAAVAVARRPYLVAPYRLATCDH